MGRYLKGRGKLQQREWKGFDNHSHMVHFLTKARQDEAIKLGVEPKKPFSVNGYFKRYLDWVEKAQEFDNKGK